MRRAAALAFLLALVAAPGAAAQPVTITGAGAERTLQLDQVERDVQDRSYALRDAGGGEQRVAVSGASLAAVLRSAEVDPLSFTYLEVARPDGGAVLLSRRQATDPGAFADGPPVLWADAAGTHFVRPAASGEDANAADAIDAAGGLVLRLRTGRLLEVEARASKRRVDPREAVTFTAEVARAGAGESLEYSWYFDDGRSASGERVTHRFARPGSYDVVVGVTSAGDDVGVSALVRVTVGEPPEGPDRRGGGSDPSAAAPDHGAASGSRRGTSDPGRSARAERRQRRRARERDRTEQRASASGEEIAGTLLADAGAPSSAQAAALRAARTGRPVDDDTGPWPPPDAVWQLGALAALLALGWRRERRGLGRVRSP